MANWRISRRLGQCSSPDCGRSFEDGERHASTVCVAGGELLRLDFCQDCWSDDQAESAIERARQERIEAAAEAERAAAEAERAKQEGKKKRKRKKKGESEEAAESAEAEVGESSSEQESASEEQSTAEAAQEEAPADEQGTEAQPDPSDDSEAESGQRDDLFWWFTRYAVGKKKALQLDMDSLERLFLQLEGRPEPKLRELRYVLCLLLMRKRRVKVIKIERGEEGESFLVRRPRREESLRVFVYDFDASRMDELRAELQNIFDGAEEEGELQLPPVEEGESDSDEVAEAEGPEDAEAEGAEAGSASSSEDTGASDEADEEEAAPVELSGEAS